MNQRMVFRFWMEVLFLCFLAAIPSRAQVANNTSLVGTVTDANGTVMGAKVTAVNVGTNDTYSATTDEPGNYSITFVREGTYTITTEQTGFRKSVQKGIGPGLVAADFSVFKDFPIKERLKFQFRAEMFNIFNHPNFGNPNTTWHTGSFGNITQTTTDNRDIQFGAKFVF